MKNINYFLVCSVILSCANSLQNLNKRSVSNETLEILTKTENEELKDVETLVHAAPNEGTTKSEPIKVITKPAPTEGTTYPRPTVEATTTAPTKVVTKPAPTVEATKPAPTEDITKPLPTVGATKPAPTEDITKSAPTVGDTKPVSTTTKVIDATTQSKAPSTTFEPTTTKKIISPSKCPSSYTGSQCNAQTYWCPDQICINDGNCFSYLYYDCNCKTKGSCHIENAYPTFLNGLDCFNLNTVSQGAGFYYNFYSEYQNYNEDVIDSYSCGCEENYGKFGNMKCGLVSCNDNSTNPCSNINGCVDKKAISTRLDISYCICDPGEPCFKERLDHCLEEPCTNSSTCLSLFTDSFFTENFNTFNLSMSYTCKCNSTDQKDCFQETDPCFAEENKCLNGGTCVTYFENFRNNTKKSACICPEGTTGNNCENFLNCVQPENEGRKACYFGGKCIHSVDHYFLGIKFTCECLPGFRGKYCDQCDSSTCENGGTCYLNSQNSIECICPYGYKGSKCEIRYDFCEFNNDFMCNNETGICSTYKDYYCHCDNTTQKCEMQTCDFYNGCVNLGHSCLAPPDYHSYGCNCYMISQILTENSVYGRCNIGNMDSCNERIYSVGQSSNWYYNTVQVENICQGECSFGFDSYSSYYSYFCECGEDKDCLIPGFSNPCAQNLCSNGSTCLVYSQLNQYTCKCESENCVEESHPCSNNPCQNGGTCLAKVNPAKNNTQEATCLCVKGAYGNFCENTNDYCMNQFCGRNGRCVNVEVGKIKCECFPGYTGKFCDKLIASCDQNPCLNNGKCSINKNVLTCQCDEGSSGRFCQNRI